MAALAAVAAALPVWGPAPAHAITSLGDAFRVSHTAPTAHTREATYPRAGHNPVTGRTLVVWSSDPAADNVREVSAQILDAAGNEIGGDFQISSLNGSNAFSSLVTIDVAVDHEHNRWLVVFDADDNDADTQMRDIFAVLVNNDGTVAKPQFRVPAHVFTGDQEGFLPHAAYDASSDKWMVTWSDSRIPTFRPEIHARTFTADGTAIGAADLRVSERSCQNLSGAQYNDVASNGTGEFLVVFDSQCSMAPNPEIFSQRLTHDLTPTPDNTDVPLTETEGNRSAGVPALAFDPVAGRYLLAYTSNRLNPVDSASDHEELFVRSLSPAGAPLTAELQASNNPYDSATGYYDLDLAAGGGRFAVAFPRANTANPMDGVAPYVQEIAGDGAMIDDEVRIEQTQFFFVAGVVRSGDTWLTLFSRDQEIHGRRAGAAQTQPPPSSGGGGGATPPANNPPQVEPPVTQTPVVAAPKFTQVVTLPATKRCVSRRKFRIRLRTPKGVKVAQAEVKVNGKRVKIVKGRRLTAPVDLRSLPKGRFKVTIVVRLADGRRVQGTRTYRTCARKRSGSGRGPKV